jgi:competence protein ComEC
VVSAGERNPYGHPAPEVLARLRRHGARVLRTDRDGMIVVSFEEDGRWSIDLPGSPKR